MNYDLPWSMNWKCVSRSTSKRWKRWVCLSNATSDCSYKFFERSYNFKCRGVVTCLKWITEDEFWNLNLFGDAIMGSGVIHKYSTRPWVEDKMGHGLPHFTILKANDCLQSVLNNKAFIREAHLVNEDLLTWIKQHQLYSLVSLFQFYCWGQWACPHFEYLWAQLSYFFFHFKFVKSNGSIVESRFKNKNAWGMCP